MRNATLKADLKHVVLLGGKSKFSFCCLVFIVEHMALRVSHLQYSATVGKSSVNAALAEMPKIGTSPINTPVNTQ